LIRKIYGTHLRGCYGKVTPRELESSFNKWARCKTFVLGDEIFISDRYDRESTMGELKTFVSNEYITINEKYRATEVLKNYTQLYLTSNHPNALPLDQTDRRFFVKHAPEILKPPEFYNRIVDWCEEEESAGKLLHYLLHDVDVSLYNPRSHAPFNEDKEEVITQGRDTVQQYVSQLVDDPELIFASVGGIPADQKLFTAQELFVVINNYAREHGLPELRLSLDGLGQRLARTDLPNKRMCLYGMNTVRLYAVFDKKSWKRRDVEMWSVHYRKTSPLYAKRAKPKYEGGGTPTDIKEKKNER
jgi:hypothetical protein